MALSVVIVDDHAPFRRATRALLEAGGFTVVGEADDGASALRAVHSLTPDVLLLDVQLPDMDGFAIAELLADDPAPPLVVLVSARDARAYRSRLRGTSARGFVPKSELSAERLVALLG